MTNVDGFIMRIDHLENEHEKLKALMQETEIVLSNLLHWKDYAEREGKDESYRRGKDEAWARARLLFGYDCPSGHGERWAYFDAIIDILAVRRGA